MWGSNSPLHAGAARRGRAGCNVPRGTFVRDPRVCDVATDPLVRRTYVNHPVDVADVSAGRDAVMAREFRNIDVYQCPVFPNDRQPLDYVSNSWTAGAVNDGASIVITKVRRSS